MKLSVIITNYNYALFLRGCIDSAMAIDHPDKEIIVVDDGSSDASREIMESYGDAIVPIFKKNNGQTDALNSGFAQSTGDLIYTLDADDLVLPNMMREVLARWTDSTTHAQFFLQIIDIDSTVTPGLHRFPDNLDNATVRKKVLRTGHYPWPPTSGNVYSRWFLNQVLPVEASVIDRTFDTYLNTLSILYGDVVYIAQVLGNYRVHDQNGRTGLNILESRKATVNMGTRDAILIEHAQKLGLSVAAFPRYNDVNYLKDRLVSLRMGADLHPIAQDRRLRIFRLATIAIAKDEVMSRQQKLVWLTWFAGVGFASPKVAEKLAKMLFVQSERPQVLVKLLRAVGAFRRLNVVT